MKRIGNTRGMWHLAAPGLMAFLLAWAGAVMHPAGRAAAQAGNGIVEPAAGEVLSGIVLVRGTATHASFLRYELAFSYEGGDWIVFAQGDRPVIDGTLAVWDTTVGRESAPVFPDGLYRLRLRVVRTDYNYDEYLATDLRVANEGLTPSPTPTLTTTVTVATATPGPGSPPDIIQPPPGILPSLTPFPTPTPRPTPVNLPATSGSGQEGGTDERQGLLQRLAAIDVSTFGRAFLGGVQLVGYIFAGLALYLVMRGAWRRIWRLILTRLQR